MSNTFSISDEYKNWLNELKVFVKSSQIKAKLNVNSQMIIMYWKMGAEIDKKIKESDWGSKLIEQLSKDLRNEFPDSTGFSRSNLYAMKKFYEFYSKMDFITQSLEKLDDHNIDLQSVKQISDDIIIHQLGGRLPDIITLCVKLPWRHNIAIIEKCKNYYEVVFYLSKAIENNWSRSVLQNQIESDLFSRQGNPVSNFEFTLPKYNSGLAIELMKDPYNFNFLNLKEDENERDLEKKLIHYISKFLLELGKGFAYLGKQYNLKFRSKDYFLDLLFYHTKLKCYIIVELKISEFKPEFIGKLNFYINVIDEILKDEDDNSTIGILLCKYKDNFEVEFSLKGISSPISVSEYKFRELPENIKNSLPSEEELLNEIRRAEYEE